MPARGILYSATGERFVAEALASAKSSLRFNAIPHVIYCDIAPAQAIDGIQFVPFTSCGNGFLDKIGTMARTPFAETIFLDTDTHVLANIDDVFDLLRRFDLAAAHAAGYSKCGDNGQSEAFHDFNTGVIAYRRTDNINAFMKQWLQTSEDWLRSPPPFRVAGLDQAAFRKVLWDSALSFYALSPEYNYRTVFPGRLVGKARIIHGRNRNYDKVAALINAGAGPRIIQPFPPDLEW